MSEVESFKGSLIAQCPGLTPAELDERIRQKKEKIGDGYLTDKGAIFLVAADLGVRLADAGGSVLTIKDLHAGANGITLKAKVLSIAPVRHLTRKDGTPLLLRTMTVYDGSGSSSVKMWDDKANLPVLGALAPGDLVRITAAYTRTDINGDITVNLGSSSAVERLEEASDIPGIRDMAVDVSGVAEGQRDVVVKGRIEGQLDIIEFTDRSGQPRKALKMRLKGEDDRSRQVVLWGKDISDIPKSVPDGARTQLAGVTARVGRNGELEIHGNEGTGVDMEGDTEIVPIRVRILSSGVDRNGNRVILVCDRNSNLIAMTDTIKRTGAFSAGDVLECVPSKSFGSGMELDEASYVGKKDDDRDIPTGESLRTKIEDIKIGERCCVLVTVLDTDSRDITTKSGDSVVLGKAYVGDDTSQIWINGWREQAGSLADLKIGSRISVLGATARRGIDGQPELNLEPYSSVTVKSE